MYINIFARESIDDNGILINALYWEAEQNNLLYFETEIKRQFTVLCFCFGSSIFAKISEINIWFGEQLNYQSQRWSLAPLFKLLILYYRFIVIKSVREALKKVHE